VNQIGIAQELVNTIFMGAVALVVIALGLSFGLGGRDIAANMLRRWYIEAQANEAKVQQAVQNASASGDRSWSGACPSAGSAPAGECPGRPDARVTRAQRLGSASPCATIPAAQMRRPNVASASTVAICCDHCSSYTRPTKGRSTASA
jgi:hypothetical protein